MTRPEFVGDLAAKDRRIVTAFFDHDQGQVFRFWPRLTPSERQELIENASAVDLELVSRLVSEVLGASSARPEVEPFPAVGAWIDHARDNLKTVLAKLPARLEFNIIAFNHEASPWQIRLVPNTPERRAGARAFLDDLEPSGSTNLFDTLVLALSDDKVDTVYLLSDGAPTTGRITEAARIVEEIRRLNLFRKVKINTIGFNLKGEAAALMRDLADDNFGAFVAK